MLELTKVTKVIVFDFWPDPRPAVLGSATVVHTKVFLVFKNSNNYTTLLCDNLTKIKNYGNKNIFCEFRSVSTLYYVKLYFFSAIVACSTVKVSVK